MKRNTTLTTFALAAAALLCSTPAHALSCGDTVSGHVTLTADLICPSGTTPQTIALGLQIGSNHTTIDLNGHTIQCVMPVGYQGSCQPTATSGIVGFSSRGISNLPGALNDITIRGPGTISGWAVGIEASGITGLVIEGVTVTGPPVPNSTGGFDNQRGLAEGIALGVSSCPVAAMFSHSAIVKFNEITNQSQALRLDGQACALIEGNQIHDNNGYGDSFGIMLAGFSNAPSNNNFIYGNTVVRNGENDTTLAPPAEQQGGIVITNSSAYNVVQSNNTSGNCGDGIRVEGQLAHHNAVVDNFSLLNAQGTSNTVSGRCEAPPPPGTFFDMANDNAGPGNVWTTNNTCHTKNAGIPAGVCM